MATDSVNSTSVTVGEALADVGARHVLGINGGKDSAALAFYLRDRVPDLEYFFPDTRQSCPRPTGTCPAWKTYLVSASCASTLRAASITGSSYGGALAGPQMRWCTKQLKIKPLEAWLGDTQDLHVHRHSGR